MAIVQVNREISEKVRKKLEKNPFAIVRLNDFITNPNDPVDIQNAKNALYKYHIVTKNLSKGLMLIQGPPREGKTTFGINHAAFLRDHFGIPVTMDFMPDERFGEFTLFDENALLNECKKVSYLAKRSSKWGDEKDWTPDEKKEFGEKVDPNQLEDIAKKLLIYKRTLLLDEGTRWFSKYRQSSNVSVLLINIVKQWGHYKCLFMLLNHFLKELNTDLVPYIQAQGTIVNCSWAKRWPETGEYRITNFLTGQSLYMTIYGPNVWPKFNSFNPMSLIGKVKM